MMVAKQQSEMDKALFEEGIAFLTSEYEPEGSLLIHHTPPSAVQSIQGGATCGTHPRHPHPAGSQLGDETEVEIPQDKTLPENTAEPILMPGERELDLSFPEAN